MKKTLVLATMLALAACSGGSGGGTSASTPVNPPVTPQGNLVTPTFMLVIPGSGTSSKTRKPNFVSTGTLSIDIKLVSVGGNPPTVTPNEVVTNISSGSCSAGCSVNGPPSPPGQADNFQVTTYDANGGAGGTGHALDQNSVTFTPTAGQANSPTITLQGIPYTIAITNVPAAFNANTGSQTANLTVTVKDHAGQTITGTYHTAVRITDPDTDTVQGTKLTGTHTGSSCTTTCIDLQTATDTVTLNYGGVAENPVVLASSNADVSASSGTAGTATFTPVLNAITSDATNPISSAGGVGVDLYTTDSSSTVGYSGTVQYKELGFTNAPYNKVLTTTGSSACSTFATLATLSNASDETPFQATTFANTAGTCTVTVTDGLTDQPNTLPTFKITYTTGGVGVSVRQRHH